MKKNQGIKDIAKVGGCDNFIAILFLSYTHMQGYTIKLWWVYNYDAQNWL